MMFAAGIISGCTTVKQGLVGEEHANVLPFAEQTVTSLAVERIDFRESEFAYLRAISEPDADEIKNLRKLLAQADEFRDEVIYYSVELVRIAEMNATEDARVQEYADTLVRMRQQFSLQLDLEETEFAAIEAEIREQTTLLAALNAAQPLIDRAGEHFESLLREIEERALVVAVEYLDNVIEGHYAEFMRYNEVMGQRRDDLLKGLALIRDIRLGNEDAVGELRQLSIMINRSVSIPDSPSTSQLTDLEEYILAQMRRDNEIVEYLSVDVDAYLKAHAELDREEAEVLDDLNVARLQIIAWTRSHQAMANGAKEPGKWLKIAMDAASASRRVR